MGSTIFKSLNTRQDGLLLFESFESSNFMLDQAWTLLNGTPVTTEDVAKEGLRSFECDLTYPWIENDVYTNTGSGFGYSRVWFFDDSTVTTGGFRPFAEWEDNLGNVYGLGVDLSVSTTFYSMNNAGVTTVTTIARADGWQVFSFYFNAGVIVLFINGMPVSFPAAIGTYFPKIRVGCSLASGTIPFGFFDWVQCTRSNEIHFYGLQNGQKVNIYDSSGTLITSGLKTPGPGHDYPNIFFNFDSPVDVVVQITKIDGLSNDYRTPLFSLAAGDIYYLQQLDMGVRPATLNIRPMASRTDAKSINNNNQSLFFNDHDQPVLAFMGLTEDQKNDLLKWWTVAKRGVVFNLLIDSDQAYFANVTAESLGLPVGSLVVDNINGVGIGSTIMLQSTNGRKKQTCKVTSIDSGTKTLTLAAPLSETADAGMLVRDVYYYPYCLTSEKGLNVTQTDISPKARYSVSMNLEEAIVE